MHIYINKNFDAKVAPARIDVRDIRGAKCDGFDVTCMRFVESLRHLASMLRHLSAKVHLGGSAHGTQESGTPSERSVCKRWSKPAGQNADVKQAAKYIKPANCYGQTTYRRWNTAQIVPLLVTT